MAAGTVTNPPANVRLAPLRRPERKPTPRPAPKRSTGPPTARRNEQPSPQRRRRPARGIARAQSNALQEPGDARDQLETRRVRLKAPAFARSAPARPRQSLGGGGDATRAMR